MAPRFVPSIQPSVLQHAYGGIPRSRVVPIFSGPDPYDQMAGRHTRGLEAKAAMRHGQREEKIDTPPYEYGFVSYS